MSDSTSIKNNNNIVFIVKSVSMLLSAPSEVPSMSILSKYERINLGLGFLTNGNAALL